MSFKFILINALTKICVPLLRLDTKVRAKANFMKIFILSFHFSVSICVIELKL